MHKVSNSNVIFQDKLGNVPELAGAPLGSRRLSIDEESQFGLKMMEKKKNPRIESIPWQMQVVLKSVYGLNIV